MKFSQKLTAAVAMLAFTSQTTLLIPNSEAGEPTVSYRQLVGKEAGNADLIREELRNFKIRVQSGSMNQQESIEAMSQSMIEKNITLADIDAFVQRTATDKEYKSFRKTLTTSLKGVDPSTMSPRQLQEVLAGAMQNSTIEGLAWSGCAGLSVGVILVVSAAIVGVVALTKSRGENRIRADYDRKRASRTESYNQEVLNLNNKTQQIQSEIASTQGRIASNNQKISNLNGQIAGALLANPNCANDPTCSQSVASWSQQIQSLMSDNQTLSNRINQLNLDLAQWQNPAYVQNQLAAANTDYQNDMNNLRISEENDLKLVPQNKALAKTLGIGAGVGAAIGAYLIVDGAQDGC